MAQEAGGGAQSAADGGMASRRCGPPGRAIRTSTMSAPRTPPPPPGGPQGSRARDRILPSGPTHLGRFAKDWPAADGPRMVRLDTGPWQDRKAEALAAHASQMSDLITDDPGGFRMDDTMQPHFLTTPELFLRRGRTMTSTAEHFDALYRDRADPWNYETPPQKKTNTHPIAAMNAESMTRPWRGLTRPRYGDAIEAEVFHRCPD